ncbi:MAG: SDR family NAD(P)-dependent oxidoreductase [Defluviitaleaceae bacterium]|nr:SDR family NAD(P)-dependent oxidoreductase [Defluviitaleaceae bacterium]
MKSVFITGADRGLGLSLCKEFLNRGWKVFATKYMEDYSFLENLQQENPNLHILKLDMGSAESISAAAKSVSEKTAYLDMIISNAALMEKVSCSLYEPPMDLEAVWRAFSVNAQGPVLLTKAFLPLMGGMKRLCYVSSEVSCITLMKNRYNDTFSYPMSKAAMNMGVRILHNDLYPQGYTFRLFHPGWMKFRLADGSLAEEGKYDPDFIGEIAAKYFEAPLHDENRLVMVDYDGYEWPY